MLQDKDIVLRELFYSAKIIVLIVTMLYALLELVLNGLHNVIPVLLGGLLAHMIIHKYGFNLIKKFADWLGL